MNRLQITGQTHQLSVAKKNEDEYANVSSLLRYYTKEELAEYLLRGQRMEARINTVPRTSGTIANEVGLLLSPELKKTRFVQFREKFSENMYFLKPDLGKPIPALSKPPDVTNMSHTFGIKPKTDQTLYELVLPKKSIRDINSEFYAFHDKKLISHHHYLPAERINRLYTSPPFNAQAVFGVSGDTDKGGRLVKKCLEEIQSTAVISAVQNKFLERTQSTLGKKLKGPCSNVNEHVRVAKDDCDAKAVIENTLPCTKNRELFNAVVHLNKLRRRLFKRADLHINDLRLELQRRDLLRIGFLPLAAIVEVAYNFHLLIDSVKIHLLLKHFQFLKDEDKPTECVDYEAFCRLLQVQYPLPAIPKQVFLENMFSKQTTYRDMCKDLVDKQVEESEPKDADALRYQGIRERILMAKRTTAKDVISPDIPTRFGLSPIDFEIPRSRNELRRIFSRLLDAEKFDEIWAYLNDTLKDPSELYAVNELRQATHLGNPGKNHNMSKPLQNPSPSAGNAKKVYEEKQHIKVDEEQPQTSKEKKSLSENIDTKAGGDVLSTDTEVKK